jgi:mRNA-degrading endonuclease toxin of MazEF toxin-antitoxin module
MFPFGGTIGAKLRPVLMLTGPLGSVPEVLTAFMTSVVPATLLSTDILMDPKQPQHTRSGLKQVTLLRLHKLATIHDSDVVRRIGELSPTTWTEVEAKLRSLLNFP